jgi:hypothetical protein
MFSEQISDEQKRLSDDGEKDIRNYHPALTNVFDALTAEQRKQCEDLAVEWNTKPLPDHVQLRYVVQELERSLLMIPHVDSQEQFRRMSRTSSSL